MSSPSVRPRAPTTNWTVVLSAATPDERARTTFVARYAPVIRRYLAARWRVAPDTAHVDDGVQDVFVECFKHGGALERVAPGHAGGFRAYLFAVTRNVARVFERQRRIERLTDTEIRTETRVPRPSVAFDHGWLRMVTADAMEELRNQCHGARELLQFEVLRLRYYEGLPPRQIAARIRGLTPRRVSKLIEHGLRRYHACLLRVMRRDRPFGTPGELERACRELLEAL